MTDQVAIAFVDTAIAWVTLPIEVSNVLTRVRTITFVTLLHPRFRMPGWPMRKMDTGSEKPETQTTYPVGTILELSPTEAAALVAAGGVEIIN